MVKKIGQVDILGISCYIWNWRMSVKLAEEVRKKNQNCMIFLGGPHVPDNTDESFFKLYPHPFTFTNYILILGPLLLKEYPQSLKKISYIHNPFFLFF